MMSAPNQGLSATLDKFKSKEDALSAFVRSFFSQSPGEIRTDAFSILMALNNDFNSPLSQKTLLKIISKKSSDVSASSLRRRLKSLVESGLVTELVDAGIDARNIYYKISPEVKSIINEFIKVLDRLQNKTNLSVSEFIEIEIRKRVSVPVKVFTKKIRHGFILVGVNMSPNYKEAICQKRLCKNYCHQISRKIIKSLFPTYEFNVISEDVGPEKCSFRYTIRPDLNAGNF